MGCWRRISPLPLHHDRTGRLLGGGGAWAVWPYIPSIANRAWPGSSIRFHPQTCRDEGLALSALYPFRPDFYGRMGYGYGTKKAEYQLRPEAFPRAFVDPIYASPSSRTWRP